MKERTSTVNWMTRGFSLLVGLLIVWSFFSLAYAEQPYSVSRTIEPNQVAKAESATITVTVTIEAKVDITGLALDEDLEGFGPKWGNWSVSPKENADATYKPSQVQWLWLNISKGATKEIVYEVTVPKTKDYGSYEIKGTVTSSLPSSENKVLGDQFITIPAVTVKRKIDDNQINSQSGGTAKVTVSITAKTDVDGLALDESLKGFPSDWGDWQVTSVDKGGSIFKPSEVQWLWTEAAEGNTKTVVYNVTVPKGQEKGLYRIEGEVQSNSPEFTQSVEPEEEQDEGIEIVECLTILYVVSHWNPDEGELDPDDDPTISLNEILNAISWWSDSTPVPKTCGETIDLNEILDLIGCWSDSKPVESETAWNSSTANSEDAARDLLDLTFQLEKNKLNPTNPRRATLVITPKVDISGLGLALDLPKGFRVIPEKNAEATYNSDSHQYLWLSLGKGERKSLKYKLSVSTKTEPGVYDIGAKLVSNSPRLSQKLPKKLVIVTSIPSLNLTNTLAYPNPACGREKIKFKAQGSGIITTKLKVYTTTGKEIYAAAKDSKTVSWDLTTNKGKKVANGVYFYRLTVFGEKDSNIGEVKKLIVIH